VALHRLKQAFAMDAELILRGKGCHRERFSIIARTQSHGEAWMTLVLGATGTIGGEVARQLIAAGARPRLLVRHPDKARAFADTADVVRGDLDDVASLRAAMRGVDKVFMMSTGTNSVALEGNVVDAALAEGVTHVVKLSVISAEAPAITFARWHNASELKLKASGLAWTMLRPGNFMTNALGWAPTIKADGNIYQPTGSGTWAAIDPADIGAVAVRALTSAGHEGKEYTLTGPEAFDGAGYAAIFTRVLGKTVTFVDVPPDAAKQAMLGSGMEAAYVDALLDLLAAMKAGYTGAVTNTVQEILGRPAATFESWAKRNAGAFRS
jgi:uncharacterized protein YbjT (DUF2867 family)